MQSVHAKSAVFLGVALLAAPHASIAQTTASTIPVRALTTVASSDSGMFRSATLRPLSSGNVLVNDRTRRRLVMLDPTLKSVKVLADTAAGAPNRYPQVSGLVPFIADSSIFVDNESQSLIVIDPNGKFGRVMAPPKASDLSRIANGTAGFDSKGRLVYRVGRSSPAAGRGNAADGANKAAISYRPDSDAIVRADFDTRSVDTITMLKIPVQKMVTISPQPNMTMSVMAQNPLPQTDDWTLLPDGTIAIVRGQDYHIDWVSELGKIQSSPKMPFDWKRITQEEKQQLLDSLKAANDKREADAAAKAAAGGTAGAGGGRGGGGAVGEFVSIGSVSVRAGADGPPPPPGAMGSLPPFRIPFTTVDANELPDYFPPVRANTMKSDVEGNVWVLPSTSSLSQGTLLGGAASAQTSSLVYDVVGRDGVVKERVKLPPGRNIGGFGPNGVVYLTYAPTFGNVFVERATITRAAAQ